MNKKEWMKANNEAIAILHRAWMEVSGNDTKSMWDKPSATLAHAKRHLLLQTWHEVSALKSR